MKTLSALQMEQLKKFAHFLDEHPGFSPELIGENATVYGFSVGECLLSVNEMEKLIDTPVDARLAPLLRMPPATSNRRLP